jgi:hypothetical protein
MAAQLPVERALSFRGMRTGDPALGDFEDSVILETVGEVDVGLLST